MPPKEYPVLLFSLAVAVMAWGVEYGLDLAGVTRLAPPLVNFLVLLVGCGLVGLLAQRALARLHTVADRHRQIFDNLSDSIYVHPPVSGDRPGRFIDVNSAACSRLGYSREELLGLSPGEIAALEKLQTLPRVREELRQTGHVLFESVHRSRDGSQFPVEINAHLVALRGEPTVLSIARDISGRKAAEEALAAEKERLAVTLASIGDGVITTDTGGRIVSLNRVAESLTGWSETAAQGHLLGEVFVIVAQQTGRPAEDPVERVLATGEIVGLANDTILIARDGARRVIADSAAPIKNSQGELVGVVLVFRDVTDKRRLAEELQRAGKLESIGALAGGIAHDYNNLLTGILGNINLAHGILEPGSEAARYLQEAEHICLRARSLNKQFLTFAKGGAPVKQAARVGELLREAVSFSLHGSNVAADFELPADLWPCELDAAQFHTVIQNLILNAREAMPLGGSLQVKAANQALPVATALPLPPGKYVVISLTDSGAGIPREDRTKIFDPYFTTKEEGHGLGLAIAYSIVKNHGGLITVDSEVGRGSTFSLYLPATEAPAAPVRKPQPEDSAVGGTILIMDDEPTVRAVAGKILTRLGYEVEFAQDGAEAIALYQSAQEQGRKFSAVIMDLTIPGGMGGLEAVARLREIDREVKAIVSSGYSDDPVMADYRKYGFQGMIPKPYRIEDIHQELHRVLDEPA